MSGGALQLCTALLKHCRTLSTLETVHSLALKFGISHDNFVAGQLLLAAVEIPGALSHARQLFDDIPFPDVFMYNTLIRAGLSDLDNRYVVGQTSLLHSLETYTRMLHHHLPPDSFTFSFLLKAAANAKCVDVAIQLHCHALTHGLLDHLFVRTSLISAYAECGELGAAKCAFDETSCRNIVMWNALLTAYFRCDDVEGAARLFGAMPARDLTSWNVMIAGKMKQGDTDSGEKLFGEMPVKNSVSWSTMITGFARAGCFVETIRYYLEAQRQGMGANEVSLTGALSATAQVGSFELSKVLHGYIVKSGFDWIVSIANALIDSYAKCGNLQLARGVFAHMLGHKNLVTWSSMITALAMCGHAQEAVDLFFEMEESGLCPDKITFVSILYACSHAGLVDQGFSLFRKMRDVYDIEPTIEHYGCMVDLYGRAGMLEKAHNFVKEMPIEPNDIVWRTLLGACSIHGGVELARLVKAELSKLDPDDSSDYVLLSNISAGAGNWRDVAKLRGSMVARNILKTPGWSSIEVGKVVYKFVAGDRKSDASEEAHAKLGELILSLKSEYYPQQLKNVLHDIEEEEKEVSISQHSEKLAVAFGMARLCEGSVIRIVKNLRVCSDCHTMMKSISRVFKREILLRDRSRFHFFKDGYCSCKDYW